MYPYFPEEQEPEVAAIFSTFPKSNDLLHIHRNGFLRFFDSVQKERAKIISTFKKENPEIHDLLSAKILSPEEISETKLKGHASELNFQNYAVAFSEIMKDFFETVETINMLHNAHIYLCDLPEPEKYTVSQYIRYHISNHFNEFFILSERMGNLLKTIQRHYRKDVRFHKFSPHFGSLKSIPVDTFKKIRRERNYHVHEKRYTDTGLEELEAIEFDLLFKISDPQLIKPLYLEKIENYHRHLLEKVKGINDMTDEMLNLFFAILDRFLFSEQGEFLAPQGFHKRTS